MPINGLSVLCLFVVISVFEMILLQQTVKATGATSQQIAIPIPTEYLKQCKIDVRKRIEAELPLQHIKDKIDAVQATWNQKIFHNFSSFSLDANWIHVMNNWQKCLDQIWNIIVDFWQGYSEQIFDFIQQEYKGDNSMPESMEEKSQIFEEEAQYIIEKIKELIHSSLFKQRNNELFQSHIRIINGCKRAIQIDINQKNRLIQRSLSHAEQEQQKIRSFEAIVKPDMAYLSLHFDQDRLQKFIALCTQWWQFIVDEIRRNISEEFEVKSKQILNDTEKTLKNWMQEDILPFFKQLTKIEEHWQQSIANQSLVSEQCLENPNQLSEKVESVKLSTMKELIGDCKWEKLEQTFQLLKTLVIDRNVQFEFATSLHHLHTVQECSLIEDNSKRDLRRMVNNLVWRNLASVDEKVNINDLWQQHIEEFKNKVQSIKRSPAFLHYFKTSKQSSDVKRHKGKQPAECNHMDSVAPMSKTLKTDQS